MLIITRTPVRDFKKTKNKYLHTLIFFFVLLHHVYQKNQTNMLMISQFSPLSPLLIAGRRNSPALVLVPTRRFPFPARRLKRSSGEETAGNISNRVSAEQVKTNLHEISVPHSKPDSLSARDSRPRVSLRCSCNEHSTRSRYAAGISRFGGGFFVMACYFKWSCKISTSCK